LTNYSSQLAATPGNFRAEKARYFLSLNDIHDHVPQLHGRNMTIQLLSMYLAESRSMSPESLKRVAQGMEQAISQAGGSIHFVFDGEENP
jgi:hypothetical protein